jgi:hypothetical protein
MFVFSLDKWLAGCCLVYVRQTGGKLYTRYKERVHITKCNKHDSKHAACVINDRHLFGKFGAVMKKVLYKINRVKNPKCWKIYICIATNEVG